jgi:predicted outer membrane repeat protein
MPVVSGWSGLQGACGSGGIIELGASFSMGSFTSQCDFSGKTLVVKCDGKTLNASATSAARFFYGNGGGSSIEVHDCTLGNANLQTGGTITNRDGAAIYATGGAAVKISNCVFEENKSNSGGAIRINSGSLVINDSTFRSNNALYSGGAIAAWGAADVMKMEVHRTTFDLNQAESGGAIYFDDGASVEIHTSTFSSNVASFGGAIRVSGGTSSTYFLLIINCLTDELYLFFVDYQLSNARSLFSLATLGTQPAVYRFVADHRRQRLLA